jgi:hypothetical protein
MAKDEWGNAHHLLITALKAAPIEYHPTRPYHGGGPAPKIDAHAYVDAAVWLCDRARPHVKADDLAVFERYVALARKQLALGVDDLSQQRELLEAQRTKSSRIPLKCAIWATHEAHNWIARPIYAGGAARPASGNLAKHLAKVAPTEVRGYLRDVEALCVRLEAETAVRDHKQALSAPAERLLWRGHANDKVTHWLLRLTTGRFALHCKVGARWALIEGDRDDVLANVSGDQFAAAVKAALTA